MIKTSPISYLSEISCEEDKDGKITIERIETSFYIKNSQNFTLSYATKIKEALERYFEDKGIKSDELKISIGQLTITEIEQYNECEKDIDDLTNKYSVALVVPGGLPMFVCNVCNAICDKNGEIKDVETSKWEPDRMLFDKHDALHVKDILNKKINGIAIIKIIKEKQWFN